MKTVLHITPHLGGGVGTVLLSYLERVREDRDFVHQVICLDYANDKALSSSRMTGFSLTDRMASRHDAVAERIAAADIVLFHWWNHPLLNALLVRESLPPARIIFWSHISGFHPPYVFSRAALEYPDLFVFTTPLSLETKEVQGLDDERRKALRVIWSTGGIEQARTVKARRHPCFTVGYIGTVDYSKLHPDFLRICSRITIPDCRFVLCGGPSEKQIQRQAFHLGIAERFTFTGRVDDITRYLSEFDVFGYPLAPYHWGTCEQALSESMAAGVPPVVLANRTESYMVEDGVTGMVAADGHEYAAAIETLYKNPGLRLRLSLNARETASRRFSMDRMVEAWKAVFLEIMTSPKTPRSWGGNCRGQDAAPSDIFIESLGEYGDAFFRNRRALTGGEKRSSEAEVKELLQSSPLWSSETRGTPRHYHYFFPDDPFLNIWSSWTHTFWEAGDHVL